MSEINHLSKPNQNNLNTTNPTTDSQISHDHHQKNYFDNQNTNNNFTNHQSHIQTAEEKNKITAGGSNNLPMTMSAGANSVTNNINNVQREPSKTYTYTPQKIYFRSTMTVHTNSDKKITPNPITENQSDKNITLPKENLLPEKSFQPSQNVSSFRDEGEAQTAQSEEKKMSPEQSQVTEISHDANSVSHVEPFHTFERTNPEQTSQSVKYEPIVEDETPVNPEVESEIPKKFERVQMIESVSYQQETMAEPELTQPEKVFQHSITNEKEQEVPFNGETSERKKKCITPWGIVLIVLGIGASALFLLVTLGVIGSSNTYAIDGLVIGDEYAKSTMIIETIIVNKTKQASEAESMGNNTKARVDDNAVVIPPIPIEVNQNSSNNDKPGMGLPQNLPVTSVNEINYDGLNDFSISPEASEAENIIREENGDKREVEVSGHLSRVSESNEY